MTSPDEQVINARPLVEKLPDPEPKDDFDDYDSVGSLSYNPYSSSSGIVICYKEGTGEVLTQETFDDTGLHFIFSKTTAICMMNEHDPLGIGSVVQIYWSRSFERVVRGSHIIVHIEKIEVFKCCSFLLEDVFVTYNSQSMAGVAIGVTKRNMAVAFHPNCLPEIRYETLRAHHEARTEFQMVSKYYHRLNTNRMVRVILASAPFKIEMNGALDKIPFFVIKKCYDLPGCEGIAAVTKVVKNIFMEATFLDTSEDVFFDSNSCHSNIQDKLQVGSIISVHASPTFPTSCFKWYGYDVTMLDSNYLKENKEHGKSFKNYKFLNSELGKAHNQHSSASSAFQTLRDSVYGIPIKSDVKKEKSLTLDLFSSANAQFMYRYQVLDKNSCKINRIVANSTFDSYHLDLAGPVEPVEAPEEPERLPPPQTAAYTLKMLNTVREALELHGLNNDRVLPVELRSTRYDPEPGKPKIHSRRAELPMGNPREVLKDLMDEDGFALNQKVKPVFVLPDTAWKPTEKRHVGIYDDLQWVMMGTFCPQPDDDDDEGPEERPLLGGWWYRRAVPRTAPVRIVKRMNTRRNIIEDCEPASTR